jgi:hypothetical protein
MKTFRLTAFVAVFLCHGAMAATITVQDAGDGAATPANCPGLNCRLRDALAAANNSDTINFAVSGVIQLMAFEMVINKNITITGPGAQQLAVDGFAFSRVFHLIQGHTVVISGLTIQNGLASNGGAGIWVEGSALTLNSCAISGNTATNTSNQSTPGGGGILIDGGASLTLNNCTVSGNNVHYGDQGQFGIGGGIFAGGPLTIINSTISGNGAAGVGGVYCQQVVVHNCVFSANTSGGPYNSIRVDVPEAAVTIGNTIFDFGQYPLLGLFAVSAGYNLVANADSMGYFTGPGDQTNIDPKLGPLQDNGGPTRTHAPLCGSPAIDHGKNLQNLTTDQRGAARIFDVPLVPNVAGGDGTDVGPVESPIRYITVTSAQDAGPNTLREAIMAANSSPGLDLISFGALTQPVSLSSELPVTDCACIEGQIPSAGSPISSQITGNDSVRIFHVFPGINVSITRLIMRNGHAGGGSFPGYAGGAIYNDHSALLVKDSALSNNSANYGGGIFNDGGNVGIARLTVRNSLLNNNSSINDGAAIYNQGASSGEAHLSVTNSTLSTNTASGNGGALVNSGSTSGVAILNLDNSTVSGNAASAGGSLFNIGISGKATAGFANTIFNAGSSGGNIVNVLGAIIDFGFNLNSDAVNPQLGPLQNNGGLTATHALLTNSPAKEAGDPNFNPNAFDPPMTNDQRGSGFPRAINRLDIGALEAIPPLALAHASSFAYHFQAPSTFIPFEINLPLSGSPGIECRSGDPNPNRHNIFFYFPNNIASTTNATVSCGTVTFRGSNGNPISVEFDGTDCNQHNVTVTLTGITDSFGQTLASTSVVVGLLLGDTTGNGVVNASDVTQTKSRSGQSVTASNFRSDVNNNTTINSSDIGLVKSQVGAGLP